MDTEKPSSMLLAAIELAQKGWPVFPCQEAGKNRPKAPYNRGGFKSATTDLYMITTWWKEHPAALIGLAIPKTLLVLDIDPRNGGSLEKLQEKIGRIPETLKVVSGRGDGGTHYYFRHPGIPLYGKNLPDGVDLKEGGKGYVIAPPSLHPATGLPYKWVPEELSPLSPVNIRKLSAKQNIPTFTPSRQTRNPYTNRWKGLLRAVENTKEGQRNRTLFWAACRMAENGADETSWEELTIAGEKTGLNMQEVARTIRSARLTTQPQLSTTPVQTARPGISM